MDSRPQSPRYLPHRARAQVPAPRSVGDALSRSEPLNTLRARLADMSQRLDTISTLLPDALRRRVRAGGVEEDAWTLMADNAAVAAKLRHYKPELEARLRACGLRPSEVKIKVGST